MARAFREMIGYQQSMATVAKAMAQGDLSADVQAKSERDVLGSAFRNMIGNLRRHVGQVQVAAETLAGTSAQLGSAAGQTGQAGQQVSVAVQQVAKGAQDQSLSAQNTNHSVDELLRAIDQVAKGAQAKELAATAEQLRELVAQFRLESGASASSTRSGRALAAVVPLRRVS